jgi:hypothetical protein
MILWGEAFSDVSVTDSAIRGFMDLCGRALVGIQGTR